MLVGLEDRKNRWQHIRDEVVQKSLIALVEFNCDLANSRGRTVLEVEQICVECLFDH